MLDDLIYIAQNSNKPKTKYRDVTPYCVEYIQLTQEFNIPKYEALGRMYCNYLGGNSNVTKR